ncbi:hypothetical protein [Candidiatus Paracoxiella cheracis]|uniref:hypothetical protein n=1 Tax=Candidiatus Paracoxiella cheracis TaxID=3405120 RepID=UPI003BF58F12
MVLFDLSSLGLISENLCQKAEKLLQGILKDYTQIMSAISYVNPNWRSQYSQFFLGNTQGKKPIWEGGVSKEIVEGKIEQGGQAKGVTSSLELRIWADLPGASSARVDSDEEDDEQPGMPEECKGLN